MDENALIFEPGSLRIRSTETELAACNDFSARFGLTLSPAEIAELAQARERALLDTGRVEFSGGVLKKLIYAFCDSPYISPENYEATLLELQDSFYFFKNESADGLTDDELIDYMKKYFDGPAQGSLDYMACTSLGELCRAIRNGGEPEGRLF